MTDKLLRCLLGLIEITSGQASSADVKFAGNSDGYGRQSLIENIDIGVPNRSSNWDESNGLPVNFGIV